MKYIYCLACFAVMLAACSYGRTPVAATLKSQEVPATSPLSETPDIFQIRAWVNDPTPPMDARIVVHGSLIKYGSYYLGGIMMTASWPDKDNERGVPNCYSLVTYGTGKCTVDVSRYSPGIYVPVTVSFTYEGRVYIAYTGFTPQEP